MACPRTRATIGVAAEMLLDLGMHRAALLTNNPAKIEGLRSHGVEVVERLPVQVEPNPFNLSVPADEEGEDGAPLPVFDLARRAA